MLKAQVISLAQASCCNYAFAACIQLYHLYVVVTTTQTEDKFGKLYTCSQAYQGALAGCTPRQCKEIKCMHAEAQAMPTTSACDHLQFACAATQGSSKATRSRQHSTAKTRQPATERYKKEVSVTNACPYLDMSLPAKTYSSCRVGKLVELHAVRIFADFPVRKQDSGCI